MMRGEDIYQADEQLRALRDILNKRKIDHDDDDDNSQLAEADLNLGDVEDPVEDEDEDYQ